MAAMRAVVLFIALGLLLYTGNVEVIENRNDFDKFSQKKGLKVSHQNIRGLLGNFCALQEFISSYESIDVLTLSETHIASLVDSEKILQIVKEA